LRIWKDPKEKNLLVLAIVSFILLCIVEIRFPLISALRRSALGAFIGSDATHNTVSGLLLGVLSAYVFYLFIDYLPRSRREQKTIEVLNSLIASVLDSYNRCRVFGHETAISHVDKNVLEKAWLDEQVEVLRDNKSKFLPLKFAMQTAYTRIEDFRHSLPLAVTLSPEHALRWLVIIDKVRLLSENYDEQPLVPQDKIGLIEKDTDDNPIRDYKSTLNLRFLEIVEEARRWLYPEVENIGNGRHL
jgi:hypothetical protein